jgi:hypothetical protein
MGDCTAKKPMCPEGKPDKATFLCGCVVWGKPPPIICPVHGKERKSIDFYLINLYKGYKPQELKIRKPEECDKIIVINTGAKLIEGRDYTIQGDKERRPRETL